MKTAPRKPAAIKTRVKKLDELMVKAHKLAKAHNLNLVALWQANDEGTYFGHFVNASDQFAFDAMRAIIQANPGVLDMGAKGTDEVKAVLNVDELKKGTTDRVKALEVVKDEVTGQPARV